MITVANVLIAIAVILLLVYFKLRDVSQKLTQIREAADEEQDMYFRSLGNYSTVESTKEILLRLMEWSIKQSDHLEEISQALNADHPAGEQSAKVRRKRNLTALYAQHLLEHEGLSDSQAEARAAFEFDRFDEERLINTLDEDSFLYPHKARRAKKDQIKEAFFATNQLERDVLDARVIHWEIYGAVWRLFVVEGFVELGHEIAVMESYSTKSYGEFVKGRRILMALVDLGIAEVTETDREGYWLDEPEFKFTTTDLEEIKSKVYGGTSHDEDFFKEKNAKGELPEFFDRKLMPRS